MQVRSRVSLVLRLVFATLWAGALVLMGLTLLLDWAGRYPSSGVLCRVLGVTLIAMGELVFAALVADRVFPRAAVGVRLGVQGLAALTFVGGLGVLLGTAVGAFM